MTRRSSMVLAILTFVVLTAGALVAETAEPSLGIEVSVKPSSEEGAYEAAIVIRDSSNGEVLSAPRIVFLAGDDAETSTKLPDGREIRFSILVNETESEATYTTELLVAGESKNIHKATVRPGQ